MGNRHMGLSIGARWLGEFVRGRLGLVAAFGLATIWLVGLAPLPALAQDATPPPITTGKHIYDNGGMLSPELAASAETMAARIQANGGGLVIVYTGPDWESIPNAASLVDAWQIDGLLMTAYGDNSGSLTWGTKLQARLTSKQQGLIDTSSGPQTIASWIMSSLARIDGLLSGNHVFDGAAALDASNKQQAETWARNLGDQLGGQVYVDISLGGHDAETAAFFNGAGMESNFNGRVLCIALSVSDEKQVGGYIDSSSDLWDAYQTSTPWSYDTMSNTSYPNHDVQAGLIAALNAIKKTPSFAETAMNPLSWGIQGWFWVLFVIAMLAIGLGSPFYGSWLVRRLAGVPSAPKGGIPAAATIQSIGDTGMTVSMPSVGPEAPEYKLGLEVQPPGGGFPYQVQVKTIVPRIFVPMVVPGARIGVLIDPTNQQNVTVDYDRFNDPDSGTAGASTDASGAAGFGTVGALGPNGTLAGTGATPSGGFNFAFDPSGRPIGNEVSDLIGSVRGGTLPTVNGSADQLLATGTHGTAVVTTAQPLGKKVRDLMPSAPAERLDDPVWVFTAEVTLPGMSPFPAVFGQRVPVDKVSQIGPGVKLAVSVDQANKNQDVAIDWNRSPLP